MTRPIKFRCWDVESKKMYPVAFPSWNGMVDTRDGDHTHPNFFLSENGPEQQGILMQFTGLLDKNGKEIYEGDILKINGVVEYRLGSGGGPEEACLHMGYSFDEINPPSEDEIIGNIYENPNLLP